MDRVECNIPMGTSMRDISRRVKWKARESLLQQDKMSMKVTLRTGLSMGRD